MESNDEKKIDVPVWFETSEFKVFLDSVLKAAHQLSSTDLKDGQLQASLKKMGRRYNHFLIQVTEFALKSLKDKEASEEEREKQVLNYIKLLEQEALSRHPKLMQLFFTYREKIRYME